MFLFDWSKIYQESDGNVTEVLRIFRMLVHKQVPKNTYDPIYKYSQKNFVGESYMLHPDVLLYHSHKYYYKEMAQYIALCSMRPYALYTINNEITLDTLLVPVLSPEEIINNNRLLRVEGSKIHFLYEEVNPTEIH
jgi:hypothetical protein